MTDTLGQVTSNPEKETLTLETPLTNKAGATKKSVYRGFLGAVAWGDQNADDPMFKRPGAVVGGEDSLGQLLVMDEFQGPYFPAPDDTTRDYLPKRLITWKDKLLVSAYYVERDPPADVRGIRDPGINPYCDGLAQYAVLGHDRFDKPIFLHAPNRWPHFRDRDTTAEILPVPSSITADFAGSLNRVNSLVSDGTVSFVLANCRILRVFQTEKPSYAEKHPLFRAMIWLIATWDRNRQPETTTTTRTPGLAWYW